MHSTGCCDGVEVHFAIVILSLSTYNASCNMYGPERIVARWKGIPGGPGLQLRNLALCYSAIVFTQGTRTA
jgi:hypothetical protein